MLTRAAVSLLTALGLAVTGVAVPVGEASAAAAATGTIGDTCLVGHWSSGPMIYLTKFRKTAVPLYGLAGTVEVHRASGRAVTLYADTQPGRGMFRGHHLREVIRGKVVSHLHGSLTTGQLSYTHNMAHRVTETFIYRHHVTRRVVRGRFASERSSYSCSDTTITMPMVVDTRLS